jgi:sorbitol-specific phosphotransferase system component IIA
MADSSVSDPNVPDATAPTDPAPAAGTPIGADSDPGRVPEVFVRGGGTTTMGHDKLFAELHANAEQRRREDDYERLISTPGSPEQRIPTQGKEAVRYTSFLTEAGDIDEAHVLLRYLTKGREQAYGPGGPILCVADIKIGDDPSNLMLMLFCQRCLEKGDHAEQCIIHASQKNRHWHLSQKGAGEAFEMGDRAYVSAGTVVDSEMMTCGRCGWRFHIDNNCVIPV